MQWEDEALILGGRRFGESGLILDVLTRRRGRRAGLVHGGAGRRKRAQLEAGNTIALSWIGRLEEQLGRFDVAEATQERAARHLESADALAVISAVTGILRTAVNEGDAAGSALFEPTSMLLDTLAQAEVWPALYVRWELGVLSALGFGLDLSACAVSGAVDGLTHVSPRSGRAVQSAQAGEYVDRLFVLPAFLVKASAQVPPEDIGAGLVLTGHFLERRLYNAINKPPPDARDRLLQLLERSGLAVLPD